MSDLAIPGTRVITVSALKYDGELHRTWPARFKFAQGSLFVLEGQFTEEIVHPLLGTIRNGTRSVEYYWTDRWYSVFRFEQPEGGLRNYYCNINLPAELDFDKASFVDLDIDVLVGRDLSYQVLDEQEFAQNMNTYNYPLGIVDGVHKALEELKELILTRRFPFSVEVTC